MDPAKIGLSDPGLSGNSSGLGARHVLTRASPTVNMAHQFDDSGIEPVQDEEEIALIKSFQDLHCTQRKEALKLELQRLTDAAKHPPGGVPPGGDGGGGGGGRQQMTLEEIDREKSEWSYSEYFEPMDRKNPSYPEFMYAALRWGAHKEEATADELRRYLAHLSYVARKASVEKGFVPEAHILYDADIRAKAVKRGWAVFSRGDTEASMDRYCVVNTETYRDHATAAIKPRPQVAQGAASIPGNKSSKRAAARQQTQSPPGANACIKHNYEGGCSENRCRWPHECRKCGDTAHIAGNCKKQ